MCVGAGMQTPCGMAAMGGMGSVTGMTQYTQASMLNYPTASYQTQPCLTGPCGQQQAYMQMQHGYPMTMQMQPQAVIPPPPIAPCAGSCGGSCNGSCGINRPPMPPCTGSCGPTCNGSCRVNRPPVVTEINNHTHYDEHVHYHKKKEDHVHTHFHNDVHYHKHKPEKRRRGHGLTLKVF